ncbi:hypothetical protein DPX16_8775 [Anabarilius grahami]|uniref:Uncharacterized protein n=1 Tax=Anabarilius grahami TaxID=495550 RepID=A0A3N0YDQ1_ANAGA|nr:hypothetical protein DPX16_8775 [Anabarilius grahami]
MSTRAGSTSAEQCQQPLSLTGAVGHERELNSVLVRCQEVVFCELRGCALRVCAHRKPYQKELSFAAAPHCRTHKIQGAEMGKGYVKWEELDPDPGGGDG